MEKSRISINSSGSNTIKRKRVIFSEFFYESLKETVDDDFATYGHSLGRLLVCELYYKISELNLRKSKHIIFLRYESPSIIREIENIYTLNDYDFIKKTMELGGSPDEFMNSQKSLGIFLHVIRSDFKILETYNYKK